MSTFSWILCQNDYTNYRFLQVPVHQLTASLDSRMYSPLHVFHAFTGCDIVSSFGGGGGNGDTTADVIWQLYPEATGAFEDLLLLEDGISDQTMSTIERFVVLLYDRANDIIENNTKVQNTG